MVAKASFFASAVAAAELLSLRSVLMVSALGSKHPRFLTVSTKCLLELPPAISV